MVFGAISIRSERVGVATVSADAVRRHRVTV
jgi:hypothetical protein